MADLASEDVDAITEAVLVASRALVAVAARSLAGVTDEVTLPQYRALVVLDSRGPQTAGTLADALGVHRSSSTRLVDRLHEKRLVHRRSARDDRREVEVSVSAAGHRIVEEVTTIRRREIAAIVSRVPPEQRAVLAPALRAFGAAAGEVPEQSWSIGWSG